VGSQQRFLTVEAGGRRYALPALSVRRVIPIPDLYPVPGAAGHLLGLGQFGGEPLAVVDLQCLGDSDADRVGSPSLVVVVAPREGSLVGLAVDRALQVAPAHPPKEVARAGFVVGVVDGDIEVLDPSWLAVNDRESVDHGR
jgi:purine-binding chemotaxis protein CheW